MKRKTCILLAVILCVVVAAGACVLLQENPDTPVVYGTVTGHNNDRVFLLDIEKTKNIVPHAQKACVVWEHSAELEVGDRVKVVTDGTQPLGPYDPNPETRRTTFYALSVKKLWWPW